METELKKGQWCWFWNKYMGRGYSPILAQFAFSIKEETQYWDAPNCDVIKYKPIELGYTYDFCEPFVGELPSIFKGKK